MGIEKKINEWDGKSTDDFKAVYDVYHTQPDFADTIITLTKSSAYQQGATWLLKAWLESGNTLEKTK